MSFKLVTAVPRADSDVGLFVRDDTTGRICLQLFLSPDVVDMACMSADRVAWTRMVALALAVVRGTWNTSTGTTRQYYGSST
jgi:hypothetical protein